MISILIGNLFESKVNTYVNTINCVGTMGKGIALEFKKRYPEMFKDYVERCNTKQVQIGKPYYYKDLLGVSVLNFPTKKHWRSPAKLKDIELGLDEFVNKYKEWGIESIAFPPLGCGNGGLDWSLVGPIMYQRLSQLNISIEIYAPYGTPKQQLTKEFLSKKVSKDTIKRKTYTKIKPSWITLLEVINNLEKQPYAAPVGRTTFQKICYIMTELKVDTGFSFTQNNYGPFSQDIKEVLNVFANSNLIYEDQIGKMTALKIGSEYENMRAKFTDIIYKHSKEITKTTDLFSRIKSTAQAEEVATVLYVARLLKKDSSNLIVDEQAVLDYILNWKKTWNTEEKKDKIISTIRNLQILNWLKLQHSDSLTQESI